MTYRIRDWGELYETASTRKRKQLGWVLVPNRHDSLGYNQIINRTDGLEIFAAWVLILQVASRCPTRGLLVSDTGKPYTAADISAKTRAPIDKIESAFGALVEIGWLESANKVAGRANKVADYPDKVAALVPKCQDEERKKDKKERKITPPTPQGGVGEEFESSLFSDPQFVRMWAAWLDHHKEKGRPLTAGRQVQHINDLESSAPAEAIKRLQLSIARDWQAPAAPEEKKRTPGDNAGARLLAQAEELSKE